eukprot:6195596-Pleurochrysis_carterae.AAC.1
MSVLMYSRVDVRVRSTHVYSCAFDCIMRVLGCACMSLCLHTHGTKVNERALRNRARTIPLRVHEQESAEIATAIALPLTSHSSLFSSSLTPHDKLVRLNSSSSSSHPSPYPFLYSSTMGAGRLSALPVPDSLKRLHKT